MRNVIEHFIEFLKRSHRVATRYDKYAHQYLGFVYFAVILITIFFIILFILTHASTPDLSL